MKTCVVNFIGGPGSGKTALACLLFATLKIKGFSVEYIPEVAKSLVWTKQFELLNNQHYVTTKQYELLQAVNGKVHVIVTDGPLLHGLYYNRHNADNFCDVQKVEKLILEKMTHFENIYIHVTKGDFRFESAGRLQTEEQSEVIGADLKVMLNTLELDYITTISGGYDLTNVIEYLVEKLQYLGIDCEQLYAAKCGDIIPADTSKQIKQKANDNSNYRKDKTVKEKYYAANRNGR